MVSFPILKPTLHHRFPLSIMRRYQSSCGRMQIATMRQNTLCDSTNLAYTTACLFPDLPECSRLGRLWIHQHPEPRFLSADLSIHMMIIGINTAMPFLLLLFHSLLAIVAALPPPLSAANATSLQLPSATPTHPDIVTTRQVILAFVAFGQQIPENEALDTLGGAVQAIGDYVRAYPDQRITNDHFDFRRKSGNVLIAITTSMGEEITWSELLEILQTLRRYMVSHISH